MKKIPLTQGKYAIVDDEDYDFLMQFRWRYLKKDGTALTGKSKDQGYHLMHRLLMGEPEGLQVDHKNHDTLDNRKSNLRVCTSSQNNMNKRRSKPNKMYSQYKGVTWDKGRNKFIVHIRKEGKLYNIGRFDNEIDAAKRYNEKAKELFGEFAYLNKVDD